METGNDRIQSLGLISNLLGDILFNLDFDKVYANMGVKFEKILSCENVVILSIKDD